MKNIFYILVLVLIGSCSTFDDDVKLAAFSVPISEIETDLAIVHVTANEVDFNEMFSQPEEEIEIDGLFNLYRDGVLVIENEAVELEIKGGYSTRYTLKTLGVKFEDKFDNSDRVLVNPAKVLPNHDLDKIKAIRLRNSGNDFENTMLKDLSFTRLAINAGLDIDLTYGEPVLVYVNGAFYGLMNIRTEANTNGMAGLNGVKKDDITLAKVTTHELIKKDGDFERIDNFIDAINRKDVDYLKDEVDLNNFIDYMIFESYIGNTDWPHNNARFYAVKEGKFRFVLFDLDVTGLNMNHTPLEIIEDQSRPNIVTDLFFTLYQDETFKENFGNRFNELLESGDLSTTTFKSIVDANATKIELEIEYQINKHQSPGTMIEWHIAVDRMVALFQERETVVLNLMAE